MSCNVIITVLIIGFIATRIRRKLMMKKLSTQLGNPNSVVEKTLSTPSGDSNRGIDKKPIICPTCERVCNTPTDLRYIGKTSICNECYRTHLRSINEQSVKKSPPSDNVSTQKSNYDYNNTSYTSTSTNMYNDDDSHHRSSDSGSSLSYYSRSDSSSDYSGAGGDTGGGGAGGDW